MTALTDQSRFGVALCYLSVGVGLLIANVDPVLAARSTLATARLGHHPSLTRSVAPGAVAATETQITPITPACPFPAMPLSEEGAATASGMAISDRPGETTITPFTIGNDSDVDLGRRASQSATEGKLDEALAIALQIREVMDRDSVLQQIVSVQVAAGQLEQALAVALQISEPPASQSSIELFVRDNALSEIAQAAIEAGQLELALQITQSMSQEFGFSTFLDLAQAYQERGQVNQASQSMARAVTAYRAFIETAEYPAYFQVLILARIVGRYAEIGQPEPALEFAEELVDLTQTFPQQNLMTLGILTGVAGVYRTANQPDRATTILADVLQATETLAAPFEQAIVFTGVAKEYAAADQRDRADELLVQAQAFAQAEVDVSNRNLALVSIAQIYGTLGQYEQALQVTTAIEPNALQDQVRQALTCSQAVSATAGDSAIELSTHPR